MRRALVYMVTFMSVMAMCTWRRCMWPVPSSKQSCHGKNVHKPGKTRGCLGCVQGGCRIALSCTLRPDRPTRLCTVPPTSCQTGCSSAPCFAQGLGAAPWPGGRRKGNCDVRIDICSFHADGVVAAVAVAVARTIDLVFASVAMCVVASLHAAD